MLVLFYAFPSVFGYGLVFEDHFGSAFAADVDSCGSVFCLVCGAV
jgi:hypothetical protein